MANDIYHNFCSLIVVLVVLSSVGSDQDLIGVISSIITDRRVEVIVFDFGVSAETFDGGEVKMAGKFPDNMLLGFASSAYQIEGAWNENGKGESVWDRFTHSHPEKIKDRSNGDMACDSYHKYREDVQLIKSLGAQIYRFSLSWSRILPKGFSNEINQSGINYYNALIDELIRNNIEPMVTLYHWDLPQPLQDLGGWPNPILADYFCDYAEVCFKYFGDKVKKWITFNEPEGSCYMSYGLGDWAPGISMWGTADYLAGHTMLKAHAKAYHLYDKNFRLKQKGEVGITLTANWREPRTKSPLDAEAAALSMQFNAGWFGHPIFSDKGDYPDVMKKTIAEASRKEGLPRSRLPEFDQYWINYIKGTSDFFGMNHYTTALVSGKDNLDLPPERLQTKSIIKDEKVILSVSPEWEKKNGWLYVVPWGFRKSLQWVKDQYKNPKVYITENGFVDTGTLQDDDRISSFQSYLQEMLKAVNTDGCRVGMYLAWSIFDNFEWQAGYTEKFGIYWVDFQNPDRTRIAKKSAAYMRSVFRNRALPEKLD